MDKLREKITMRGTVDCPFAQYFQTCVTSNVILTEAHWHPEYEILYVKTEMIELKSDKQTYLIASGDVAFIQPGRIHSIKGINPNSCYYAFVFSLELLTLPQSHFFQKEIIEPIKTGTHQFPHTLSSCDSANDFVSKALDQLILCSKSAPNRKHIVFSSIMQIFLHMSALLQPCCDLNHHSNQTIKQALLFMTEHYSEHITLQQISTYVHLHPNYLCALFKDYTGQTAFQHLNRIRIEKAADLLKSQTLSVSEAASRCGFESTGFFSKKFKEHIGISPKEYSLKQR